MGVKLDNMSLKAKLPIWVFILVASIGIAMIFLLLQYRDSILDEMKLQSLEDAYWTNKIPQKNELSGWKTYRNETYGYELKYPEGWVIDNTYSDSRFTLRGDSETSVGGDTYWANYVRQPEMPTSTPADYRDLYLLIYKFDSGSAIEDFVNNFYYKYGQTDIVQRNGLITLNNTEGRQYNTVSSDHPVGVKGIFTVFKLDDKFFVFKSSWQSADIHNQILSTFKFIEPVDTSDWKTYSSEKYKFSFKYPADFKIKTDTVRITYPNGKNWYRLELTDSSTPESPLISFEVNPDGYGPFFPDKTYEIKELENGKIEITNIVLEEKSENSDDGYTWIIPNSIKSNNGNDYFIQFIFKEDGKDWESIFNQILSTIKFIK